MKSFKTALAVLGVVSILFARPYDNEKFQFTQPDGTPVTVFISGDEFYQHVETPDGYTVIRDENGWIRYADVTADSSAYVPGEIYRPSGTARAVSVPATAKHARLNGSAIMKEVTQAKAGYGYPSIEKKSRSVSPAPSYEPFPVVIDSVKALTVLIDFSDRPSDMAVSELESMINGDNYTGYGNKCSVKEWFSKQSEGKLTYTSVVYGYYRAKQTFAYYDQVGGEVLATEILNYLQTKGFNFSQLTTVGGSTPLNLYYAGASSASWGKGLWPHQGWINTSDGITGGLVFGGKKFMKYQITNIGKNLEIGTYIHENGHMLLGYPDLYPYYGSKHWVLTYDAMGLGSTSGGLSNGPVPFNPYFREMSGWIKPIDLSSTPNVNVTVTPSERGDIRKFSKSSNPAEYYYIDARKKTGFSSTFASEGLIIWKIDTEGRNTSLSMENGGNPTRPFAQVLEQDNNAYLGQAADFYVDIPGTAFTAPRSNWYDGSASGLTISKVSPFGSTMTYQLGTGGVAGPTYSVTASVNNSLWGTISPSGTTTAAGGSSLEYTFTAKTGCQFDSVLVDGSKAAVTGNSYTISGVQSDKTIKAFFSVVSGKTYTITSSVNDALLGSITPSGATTVSAGGSQTYTFTASPGNQFDSVLVDGSKAAVTGNSYTISGVQSDKTIKAFFSVVSGKTYTITSSVNDALLGSITPSGSTTVSAGGSQTYTFTAAAGNQFDSVLVDGSKAAVTGNSYTISGVQSDKTIKAFFSAKSVTGCTDPDWDASKAYLTGEKVTYNFHTYQSKWWNAGNRPDLHSNGLGTNCWTDLGECRGTKVPVYNLTVSVNNNQFGTISPAGTITVDSNAAQTFTVTANSGYKVDSVTCGTELLIGKGGEYTTSPISANSEVIAWFSEDNSTPILSSNKKEKTTIAIEQNPVPADVQAVTFTIPQNSRSYRIVILDVTGNAVFHQEGTGAQIRWDLTNNQGTRVSGSFRVVVQIVDESGAAKVWDSIIGVQK